MLQRSRGKTVAKVYESLFRRWPTITGLARASEEDIAEVIRPLGLVKRAKTIKALANAIKAKGGVPRSIDELLELPGIGRYAASATAAVAFNYKVPTVDGVSARVYRRYFGMPTDTSPVQDSALWDLVAATTPGDSVREWNWAVLDLAASICLPKRPRCEECPLRDVCLSSLVKPRKLSLAIPRLGHR